MNIPFNRLKDHLTEFASLLEELNKSLKKSKRLLISNYHIIDPENNFLQYDLSNFTKVCDFVTIFYVYYYGDNTTDKFKDPTILWKYSYFEKLVNFTADVSNVMFGINFSFAKYTMREGKYYFLNIMSYNDFCHFSCSENCEETFDAETNLVIVRYRVDFSHEDFVFSYARSRTIANQVRFAMKLGFGGIMTGAVNDDDIYGKCGLDDDIYIDFKVPDGVVINYPKRTNAKSALLKTVNEAIALTLDEMQQQTRSPNVTTTSRSSRIVNDVPILLGGILMFHKLLKF